MRPRITVFLCSLFVLATIAIADDDVADFVRIAQPPTSPRTLPPVEVTPNIEPPADLADDSDVAPGEFDRPFSFPNLSDQFLGGSSTDVGGLNSVLRDEKSLFDQSNLGTITDFGTLREKMAGDMLRALQNEVGVTMQATGRGQSSPFLRGVTGQQVLILVDGIRVNNQTFRAGPNQYFNTIDPGQVERIEVLRGAGSVPWGGDAIGGVINIVTRGANSDGGNYGGGSFRNFFSTSDSAWYGRANVEGWVGSTGVFAGGSYMDVHDLDRGGSLGRQPFTSFDQYAGDIKFNRMIGDDQMLTFALSHFEQQNLPRSDRFAPFVFNRPGNTPRPTFFDPQQRDLAYVRWQGYAYNDNALFDLFSVTGSYTRTKEGLQETRSATRLDQGEFTDNVGGLTLTLNKDLDAYGRLTYGAEQYHDDINSTKRSVNPSNPAAPATPRTPQYPDDAFADRIGTFASWDVQLTQRLNAVVEARFENVDLHATPNYTVGAATQDIHFERTYQEWIGSIGLSYAVTDEWNLVGGVYEGFRAPTIDDLTASTAFQQNSQQDPVLASLSVQPEHSYTYEIGAKFNGERLRVQVYEWWMNIDNYIARNVDSVGNVFLANHEAYLNGTELAGEYLLHSGWAAYGNFAYTYGQDRTDRQPYSRIPPTQGILGLRWRSDDRRSYFDIYTWLVNRQDRYNSVNLTDSRFYVNGVAATPGYGTLNLRCGTPLGQNQNHRVSLVLENITNQYYRVLGSGVDGTGFNAILGYEYVR